MANRLHTLTHTTKEFGHDIVAPGKQTTYTGEFSFKNDIDLWADCGPYARYVIDPTKDGLTITLPKVSTVDISAANAGHDIEFINISKYSVSISNEQGAPIGILEADKNATLLATESVAKHWIITQKTSSADPNDIVEVSLQEAYQFSKGSTPSIQMEDGMKGFSLMDTTSGLKDVLSVRSGSNFTLLSAGNVADGKLAPVVEVLGGSASGDKSFALGEGAKAAADNTVVISAGLDVTGDVKESLTLGAKGGITTVFGTIPEGSHNTSPYFATEGIELEKVVPGKLTQVKIKELEPGTVYQLDLLITGKDVVPGSDGMFTGHIEGTFALGSKGELIQSGGEVTTFFYPPGPKEFPARMELSLDESTLVLNVACADTVSGGSKDGACRVSILKHFTSLTVSGK